MGHTVRTTQESTSSNPTVRPTSLYVPISSRPRCHGIQQDLSGQQPGSTQRHKAATVCTEEGGGGCGMTTLERHSWPTAVAKRAFHNIIRRTTGLDPRTPKSVGLPVA